jgi:hypothetical protein
MGVPVSNCSALAYYPSQRLVTHNIAPKLRQNRFKYSATACTRRQLALALLMQDEGQIEYYEKRLSEMPLPVLKKRSVISETNGVVRLEIDKLSLQEKAPIRLECDSLIQKFILEPLPGLIDS